MSKKFTTKEARVWSEAMVSALTERLGEPTSTYTPKDDEKALSYEWRDVTLPNGAVIRASVYPPKKGANGRYNTSPWVHIRVPVNVDESNYRIGSDNGKRNLHLFDFDGHTIENAIIFSDAHIERTFRCANPEILPENNPDLTPFIARAWHNPVAIHVHCRDGWKDDEKTFTVSSYTKGGGKVRECKGVKYSELKAHDGRFIRLSAANLINLNKTGWNRENLMKIHEFNRDLEKRRKENREKAA